MAESKHDFARRLLDDKHPDSRKPEHEVEKANDKEDARRITIECHKGDAGTGRGYSVEVDLDHDHGKEDKAYDWDMRRKCCHKEAMFKTAEEVTEYLNRYL